MADKEPTLKEVVEQGRKENAAEAKEQTPKPPTQKELAMIEKARAKEERAKAEKAEKAKIKAQALSSLAKEEEIIKSYYKEFIKVGRALVKIRDEKLFKFKEKPGTKDKACYKTFSDYVEGTWGYRSRAYQQIAATEVHDYLVGELKVPETLFGNESAYRNLDYLTQLKKLSTTAIKEPKKATKEKKAKIEEAKKIKSEAAEILGKLANIAKKPNLSYDSIEAAIVVPPTVEKKKAETLKEKSKPEPLALKEAAALVKIVEAKIEIFKKARPKEAEVLDKWSKSIKNKLEQLKLFEI